MSPEQRAFEILFHEFGGRYSRETFRVNMADAEGGRWLRRFHEAIARGIAQDRAAISSAGKLS